MKFVVIVGLNYNREMICKLCGEELGKEMESCMAHLMTEHNADPNEDFIDEHED